MHIDGSAKAWPGPPRLNIRGPLLAGVAALAAAAIGLATAGLALNVDRGITLVGNLRTSEAARPVTHGAGGTIVRVHVREGEWVAAGDLLVSLDRSDLDSQIEALVARAEDARGRLAAARAEARALLERIDDSGMLSEGHVEDLDGLARRLQKDVVAIDARIGLAEQQLAQTEVRALISGRLVALTAVAPGDVVLAGVVLAEIAPPEAPVAVEARLSPAIAARVAAGDPAKVWLTGLHRRELTPAPARVTEVARDGIDDRRVGLAFHAVRIELAATRAELETRAALHQGQRVEVLLPEGVRPLWAHVLAPVRRNIDPAIRRWLKE